MRSTRLYAQPHGAHFVIFSRRNNGNGEAHALRWQDFLPIEDQLLIRTADRSDLTIKVEQSNGPNMVVSLAQGGVPINLVGQRVPSEADDRHTIVADAQHIRPLFPEPVYRLLPGGTLDDVGFSVHDRQPIAIMILARDFAVAKNL